MTMRTSALADMRRERPEWAAWLHVLESMLDDSELKSWEHAVPSAGSQSGDRPALADAEVRVEADALRRTFERLVHAARSAGIGAAADLSRVLDPDVDLAALFAATVCEDRDQVTRICGADAAAAHTLLALAGTPLLQACGRRYADVGAGWRHAYCPVCAAWPAFIEVRGIERARFARCGRCGCAWHVLLLSCGYCGTSEHARLVSLVAQEPDARATIEACTACGQYTKAISTLTGCAPRDVCVNDLASVALDLAALESGYTRPQGLGCALSITVNPRRTPQRLFRWGTS